MIKYNKFHFLTAIELIVIIERLLDLLKEKFQEEEFHDFFPVEIKHHQNNTVVVYLDSDSGVTFRSCQRVSRFLEGHIDENNWLGEKYVIEVSSPGIDRSLVMPRQYSKHIGRKLEVKHGDEKTEGVLTEVSDIGIILNYKVRVKEGKKKRTEIINKNIAFVDIRKAKIKISFSK